MYKKIIPTFLGLLLIFLSGTATSGHDTKVTRSNYDSYIVLMDLEPTIAYEGTIPGYEATKPARHTKINSKSAKVKKYKKKLRKEHDKLLDTYGLQSYKVHDYSIAINGFSVHMTYQQAQAMALNKKVINVIPDRLHQKQTDNSPTFLSLNGKKGPWAKGVTGEGVIIGVIDSGIWPEHPSFADDGSYPDLGITLDDSGYANCDFGNTAHRPDDAAFDCNNKLLGARQILPTYRFFIGAESFEYDSARDEDGHGTHTTSTAGGNAEVTSEILGRDLGLVTGVAPRARIIAYKALGDLGGFSSDLAAAIDQAVSDGVDVINYSIGSGSFAIGADDTAFLFAEDAGVFVATSNGNNGPGAATTGSPASVPWVTSVGASTHDRTYQGSATSADGDWEFFGASITGGTGALSLVDAADAGDSLCNPGALDPGVVSGNIVLCLRGDIARIDKSLAVSLAGGAGMILYNANDGQSQVTDTHHVPSVHLNNTDGQVIKAYIGAVSDPIAQINGGEFTEIDAPWMAGFSSRGPNLLSGDIIKPDITAPGVNILAGDSPDNRGELFQMISGTSMSSPHVAGIFALIKQMHPDWTPAMAKSALMTTSHQDVMKEDGLTPADSFDMGAGHVVPGGDPKKKGSLFNPGLVYNAGLFEYAGFTCGAELDIFSAGTCDFLAGFGVPMDPSNLNLPSIGIAQLAGSETVYRTVTRLPTKSMKAKKYYVNVEAPPGYEVSVSPDVLKLGGGESATYAVTVSSVSGPIGVWEHGSLGWSTKKDKKSKKGKKGKKDKKSKKSNKGKDDLVYSPIAVKGALIGVPELIRGVGEDGSASFDVSFGYTGNYATAAHGLMPAVVTMDAVFQDPDQTFDPTDGFSNGHSIMVSGAAVLRVAIPPEATHPSADLDIFLENPLGEIVAASTNGGTDEEIEITFPMDGEWVLWVHGWSAPLEPTAYDLYSWVISATPGGNLIIDAAPNVASIGTSEVVDVSWSGATAGGWHYGIVSHSDGGGPIGLTRVEVDNR
jgi:subtilisin family serine protease